MCNKHWMSYLDLKREAGMMNWNHQESTGRSQSLCSYTVVTHQVHLIQYLLHISCLKLAGRGQERHYLGMNHQGCEVQFWFHFLWGESQCHAVSEKRPPGVTIAYFKAISSPVESITYQQTLCGWHLRIRVIWSWRSMAETFVVQAMHQAASNLSYTFIQWL